MKKILPFVLILLAFAAPCLGASLVWDASTGNVKGYKVYYWDRSVVPESAIPTNGPIEIDLLKANTNVGISPDIPPDVQTVENLQATYYLPFSSNIAFAVSAFNDFGESPACQPVIYNVPDAYTPAPERKLWTTPPEAPSAPEQATGAAIQ